MYPKNTFTSSIGLPTVKVSIFTSSHGGGEGVGVTVIVGVIDGVIVILGVIDGVTVILGVIDGVTVILGVIVGVIEIEGVIDGVVVGVGVGDVTYVTPLHSHPVSPEI